MRLDLGGMQIWMRKFQMTIEIDRGRVCIFDDDLIMSYVVNKLDSIYGKPILVGSRGVFKIIGEYDTDYDFILKYDSNTFDDNFLKLQNLTNKSVYFNSVCLSKTPLKYFDSECHRIIKIETCDGRNVDVVFRTDPEFYIRCLEMVTPEFYEQFLWKSSKNFRPSNLDISERYEVIKARFEDLYKIRRRLDKTGDI